MVVAEEPVSVSMGSVLPMVEEVRTVVDMTTVLTDAGVAVVAAGGVVTHVAATVLVLVVVVVVVGRLGVAG